MYTEINFGKLFDTSTFLDFRWPRGSDSPLFPAYAAVMTLALYFVMGVVCSFATLPKLQERAVLAAPTQFPLNSRIKDTHSCSFQLAFLAQLLSHLEKLVLTNIISAPLHLP